MNNTAYIALGSNIGKKETYLKEAVKKLHEHPEVQVESISSIYETTPVGYENQDDFLNMAVKISTSLRPNELLALTQKIEQELGRTREVRWGPRTADLDILLYNRENIETEQLVVPHPRMYERLFVLVPMSEICPEIGEVQINAVTDQEGVSIWKKTCGVEEFVHTES
ncbi:MULTISPECIES: 2-amino-4-hydroxy-6-hydroxymethyldihydropteridine diphosphokinase [Bacillus]|uniref:2-amino-4-hydroxy-6-hydroxymethyldihydropteridine diphosphokinase n=1 Tax=Bacillus pumilus (strain SAFR-032) TaxID=315750 RepID=A8F946_BACP2|nr:MULTISPECIES: 2-amino-4-hydroxy-6-hydroxymethyldihydropteridine diphosphokinase [Bacillus]ABV60763.1 2-amino-4-hydroxy-6- hydroxymethyldihydropteridine pyrophosphokinase [Bacillus pumilus SAFR-032]MBC3644408.1 2-amino-4-hydroxy-6-hydroxymethyldihydropteridine diphosphokinase [Bacillus pumilus]MBC3647959.1 2-amino-4-hydroxy-6-hydroxymethyldihydropteridine diphosphokinase [Bacillus pumilus]MBC3651259.1 2-amino-4-hydroxy-6-hydroxymethyldihydropteridine diphosphokinase [Bacillus pumilus]MBC3655